MAGISYVLTSYNKSTHLPCVLKSISIERSQTDGEIIIVDEGSTDNSIDICQVFAATHPDVTFIKMRNRSVYAAYNRAIPLVKNKWLRLCDCDTPLIAGSTQYLAELATLDEADIVYGHTLARGVSPLPISQLSTVRPVSYASQVRTDALLHLIQAMDLLTSRALYRASKARQGMPLPENLISCPDFALALRVAAAGRLVKIDEPVCYSLKALPAQQKLSEALKRHQIIRILQASRRLLERRHRNASILELYKWSCRSARKDVRGWRHSARKMRLKLLMTVTSFGLYDWHSALDAFASQYEKELAPLFL
ncbi:MAG: glycosyltransferase, partial [Alphaproteobacteria bacterium]